MYREESFDRKEEIFRKKTPLYSSPGRRGPGESPGVAAVVGELLSRCRLAAARAAAGM